MNDELRSRCPSDSAAGRFLKRGGLLPPPYVYRPESADIAATYKMAVVR